MTRLVHNGLEFQFLYLPKSTSAVDFTIFHWTDNISKGWEEVRQAAEAHKRDLVVFDSQPLQVFGITSPNIQSRIISGNPNAIVTTILQCDPKTGSSNTEQYRSYLRCEPSDPGWIIENMMVDVIPHYYSQHVSESSIYWVDNRTGISTWAHPHYLKYSFMLARAREHRPRNDAKYIALFQFSCLFDQLNQPLLSLDNVSECARILNVSLRQEPFLTETVKAALRFFSHSMNMEALREFHAKIDRKRREFNEIRLQVGGKSLRDRGVVTCVECEKEKASIHCSNCEDYFCLPCFKTIHSSGARKHSHVYSMVEIKPCDECQDNKAMFHCLKCLDSFCEHCFSTLHSRGGRRNHVAVILRCRTAEKSHSKMFADFEAAKSVWIKLDGDGVPLYVNLETNETRRDPPLSAINTF